MQDFSFPPNELEKQAQKAYQEGHYLEAAKKYEELAKDYSDRDNRVMAAEMANNASVAYLMSGYPNDAFRLVDGTAEVFKSAGDDRRFAFALSNLAAVQEETGDIDEAIDNYRNASQIFDELGDQESYATVLRKLSVLRLKKGNPLEALGSMETSLLHDRKKGIMGRLLKWLLMLRVKLLR